MKSNYKYFAVIPTFLAVLCVIAALWLLYHQNQFTNIPLLVKEPLKRQLSVHPSASLVTGLNDVGVKTHPPLVDSNSMYGITAPFRSSSSRSSSNTVRAPRFTPAPVPVLAPISTSTSTSTPIRVAKEALRGFEACAMHAIVSANPIQQQRVKKFTFFSANRDTAMYETAAYYKIQIPVLIRNVIGVSIVSAIIPRSEYNINAFAHYLDIYIPFTATVYSIDLAVGTYSTNGVAPTDFALALANAIAAFPALATYTVTYNTLTAKLEIRANTVSPFQLLFKTGPNHTTSMWSQMGFPCDDTPPALVITAPGRVNLVGTTSIEVYIDEITVALENEPVALINVEPEQPYTAYTATLRECQQFWPIGKLAFITLRFVTNGRLYEFNGMENTICLEFKYLQYKNVIEDEIELDP